MFKTPKLVLLMVTSLFLFACQNSVETMGDEQEETKAEQVAENVEELEKEVKTLEVKAESDTDELLAVHLLKDNPSPEDTYHLATEDRTIAAGDVFIEVSKISLELAKDDDKSGYVHATMEFSADESVEMDAFDYPYRKTELHIGNARYKIDEENVAIILDEQETKEFKEEAIHFERESDGMQYMVPKTAHNENNLSVVLKVSWPVKDLTRLTSSEDKMHIHFFDHEGDQVVDLALALEVKDNKALNKVKAKAEQYKSHISMVIEEELTNTDTSVEDIIVTYDEHDYDGVDNYSLLFKILYKGDVTSSNHYDNYDLLSYLTYRLSLAGHENFYNVTVDWTCYDTNGKEVDYLTFVQGYMSDGAYVEKESQTHYIP